MRISVTLLSLLSLALFEGADAAGNEEKVLINTKSIISENIQNRTSYQCTYRNLWTKGRQPKNFPQELGRWNGPIMWTHTLQFQPWHAGYSVTRGVEKFAEVSSLSLFNSRRLSFLLTRNLNFRFYSTGWVYRRFNPGNGAAG